MNPALLDELLHTQRSKGRHKSKKPTPNAQLQVDETYSQCTVTQRHMTGRWTDAPQASATTDAHDLRACGGCTCLWCAALSEGRTTGLWRRAVHVLVCNDIPQGTGSVRVCDYGNPAPRHLNHGAQRRLQHVQGVPQLMADVPDDPAVRPRAARARCGGRHNAPDWTSLGVQSE